MPDPFHFELVSPERLMFSGEVEAVIVPGTEGQFTVLKDHAPLMTRLKPGIVEVDETATPKIAAVRARRLRRRRAERA